MVYHIETSISDHFAGEILLMLNSPLKIDFKSSSCAYSVLETPTKRLVFEESCLGVLVTIHQVCIKTKISVTPFLRKEILNKFLMNKLSNSRFSRHYK